MTTQAVVHVGFGKTGSSALQAWLANSAAGLAEQGYRYSGASQAALDYKTSTGNGTLLYQYVRGEASAQDVIDGHFTEARSTVIISSEVIPAARPDLARRLLDFFESHEIEARIVAYVRNPLEWAYSSYVQHIKGRGKTGSFLDHLYSMGRLPHLQAATWLDANAPNCAIIHYDQVRDDVAAAFAAAVGIDYSGLEPIRDATVNRGLGSDEVRLVQFFQAAAEAVDLPPAKRNASTLLSDWLVNTRPDRRTEYLVTEEELALGAAKFGAALEEFNDDVGSRRGIRLRLYNEGFFTVGEPNAEVDAELLAQMADFLFAIPRFYRSRDFLKQLMRDRRSLDPTLPPTFFQQRRAVRSRTIIDAARASGKLAAGPAEPEKVT